MDTQNETLKTWIQGLWDANLRQVWAAVIMFPYVLNDGEFPDAPCMEYLPTFNPKITQM